MSEVLDSLHPTLRDLPGTTIVGRYRVDGVLGVGGMGVVFSGRHLGLERDVAIKVLHPDLTRDPEISKRFDREAHSASRLDHPNCLRVTDVGSTDEGTKFMVMDLLSGGELAERLGDPIVPERSVLMMLQVLRGLEHAHEHGVIHRDIKPENIFITRDHEGCEVLKLVDFGIAKLVGGGASDRMTKAGLIFGTPAYMSPEQAMGMEADGRADLYAVGVILYEMIVGTAPFSSDDPVKLVRMQVSKEPPPLPDALAPALTAVIMKLLAKDRDERFQSATEAREALELVLPAVASSEIISGATMHGSSVSGPILVNPAISGPISVGSASVPLVRIHDPSGSFSPSALPTLPPQAGALRNKPMDRRLLIGGGVALAVVALWFVSRGGEGDGAGSEADNPVMVAEGEPGSKPGQKVEAVEHDAQDDAQDGPDKATLDKIDQYTFANNLEDAQKALQPVLDEYPDNAILAWRQGRIFAKSKRRKNHPKALAAYGDALDAKPDLIEDADFYAELHALLGNPKLRADALDFALRKMGRRGHKFLLGLVNDDRDPMGYGDRRRALQELSTVDENDSLVDWNLHVALDLLQATEALTPCLAYREALDSIANSPDYWYLPRVQRAAIPMAKTGEELSEEDRTDATHCEGLELRRDEVIVVLEALAPESDTDGEIIIDDDEDDEGSGESAPSKSKGKGKSTSKSTSKSKSKSKGIGLGCNLPPLFRPKRCK